MRAGMPQSSDAGAVTTLAVRLRPNAAKNAIQGWRNGILHAGVTASPEDGRANRALIILLAEVLEVAPSRIAVVRGAGCRQKLLRVDGLHPSVLHMRLGGQP
jgi:uncharacterized protein